MEFGVYWGINHKNIELFRLVLILFFRQHSLKTLRVEPRVALLKQSMFDANLKWKGLLLILWLYAWCRRPQLEMSLNSINKKLIFKIQFKDDENLKRNSSELNLRLDPKLITCFVALFWRFSNTPPVVSGFLWKHHQSGVLPTLIPVYVISSYILV